MKSRYSPRGIHILCDMYEIKNKEILKNKKVLEEILVNAAKFSKAKVVDVHVPEYFVKKGRGLTIYVTVKESSFEVHTYPEKNCALFSFHTCGKEADPEKGLEYIINILQPKKMNFLVINRGKKEGIEIVRLCNCSGHYLTRSSRSRR